MSLHLASPVLEFSAPVTAPEPRHDRIIIKSAGDLVFLRCAEIDWVEAQRDYMRLHVSGRTFLLRATMTQLLQRLAATSLVRIHRSTIINADRLLKLTPTTPGHYDAVLLDGRRLKVARAFYASLIARLAG